MKRPNWLVLLGLTLVVSSALAYFVHYLLFRDTRHIFLYLIGDLAFLPVQVLFVTLIVDRLLGRREKTALLKKLNMVIGIFFSELGTPLLKSLASFDRRIGGMQKSLVPTSEWSGKDFTSSSARFARYDPLIECEAGRMEELRSYLEGKRDFLLTLMENPNLLEHESFTDLLWSVFHLAQELAARKDLRGLPETDYAHLSGDIKRAYRLLISEWFSYMRHLKEDYPYLYSLAVRMNPFDPESRPEVR
ncbi:MAG TPA: hypothetical protein VJ386_09305 [Candidatus Deferrimicrobiaceae bacterium]|nr:hypothetical protein [Candidatus Deferrimicrobiaceae bacterium]